MKNMLRKAVSLLLAVMIVFGSVAVGAAEIDFAGIFSKIAEAATTNDNCGDNLTWIFDESTGTLTISGTGDMYDYSGFNDTPWYDSSHGDNLSRFQSVEIGEGVTSIGSYAFSEFTSVTSIEIPASVTKIGEGAFFYCMRIESVTFGENSQLTSIGNSAFGSCESLTSIEIPSGVTTIDDYTFSNCYSLTYMEIPTGVTSIGNYAFYYCTGLTSIEIPSSVTSIGDAAFENCTGLTSVEIPDSVTSIDNDAFFGCDNLTNILFGENSQLTSIGIRAFAGCTSLVSIVIPDTVISIEYHAFWSCQKLESIEIPGSVTFIGDSLFLDCINLKSITVDENNDSYSSDEYGVLFNKDKTCLIQYSFGNERLSYTIPNGVIKIDFDAFCGSTLTNIEIPNTVTHIGDEAFGYCKNITNIEIPSSVTSIGIDAFYDCTGLTSVAFGENSQLTSIGYSAFSYCTGLTSIEIPASVTSIGYYAFRGCSGLTSVTFDEKSQLTSIGDDAFFNCDTLLSVELPNGVTSIGDYAFGYCDNLEYVHIPASVTSIGTEILYSNSETTAYICSTTEDCYAKTYADENGYEFRVCTHNAEYTVTFNTDFGMFEDGTNEHKITAPAGTAICPYEEIPGLEMPGYVFCGWRDEQGVSYDHYSSFEMPAENITLYAVWEQSQHTILYHVLNYETQQFETVEAADALYGTEIPPFPSAYTVPDGYVISSAYTDETFSTYFESGTIMPMHDYNLYYYLEPAEYTVTFNALISEFEDGSRTYQISAAAGTLVNEADVPVPERRLGYLFSGWSYEDKTVEFPFEMPAEDVTLYAVWDIFEVTVTFDANGGVFADGSEIYSYTAIEGELIAAPEDPTRDGYTFMGWIIREDDEPMSAEELGSIIAEPMVITAVWEENEYTLTLRTLQAGTYIVDDKISQSYVVKYGEVFDSAPTPYGEGWEFVGWQDSAGNDVTLPLTMPAEDLTLIAKWEAESYKVYFVDCGLDPMTVEYNNWVTVPEAPEREGHIFNGWDENGDGSIDYQSGNIFAMPAHDVYLHAVWSVCSYTVSWIVDGSVWIQHIYDYGAEIIEPEAPTKTGYTFAGWSPEVPEAMPAQDMEFIATWAVHEYTIIFDANGGAFSNGSDRIIIVEDYNKYISVPNAPTKLGYVFAGWDAVVPQKMPARDMMFRAVWMPSDSTPFAIRIYIMDTTGVYSNITETLTYGTTGEEASIEPSTAEGFTFNEEKSVTSGIIAADGSLVLEVYYDRNIYNFTTVVDGTETATKYYYDSIVAEPVAPEKTGYTFTGWVDAEGNPVSFPFNMPAEDVTVYAAWEVCSYTLTINYVTADGTKLAESYVGTHQAGSDYSIPCPTVYGYTCNPTVVEGTMGNEDEIINVYYAKNTHELYIKAFDEVIKTYQFCCGDEINISIEAPEYEGYTYEGMTAIPPVMPDEDVTVELIYSKNKYTLTIEYVYSDGTKAADTVAETVGYDEEYSFTSPEISGYQPNFEVISGKMGAGDASFRVTYTVNGHNVYIKIGERTVETLAFDYGEEIRLDSFEIPEIKGHTYKEMSEYPATMPDEDVTIYLEYEKNKYKLDITYVYYGGGAAHDAYSAEYEYGESYKVDSPVISGCIADKPVVSGVMDVENIKVEVVYKASASVTYDPNGAMGNPPVQPDVAQGDEITVQGPGDLYKIYAEDVGEEARLPIDVVLLLDSSGSMSWNDSTNLRKTAAKEYANSISEVDRVAVVDFDEGTKVLCGFTNDKSTLTQAIGRTDSSGGTNIGGGVSAALSLFDNLEQTSEQRTKIIILLTDGDGSYISSLTSQARNKGVAIYTIGLGSGINRNLLQSIADGTDGQYFHLTSASALVDLFDIIRQKTVTIRYEFLGWLASDESGEIGIFEEGDKLVIESDTVLKAIWGEPDKMYIVEWVVGNVSYKYVFGKNEIPVFEGSTDRPADGYTYTFLGWDADEDGTVDFFPDDSFPPVTGRTKYVAVYHTEKIEATGIVIDADTLKLYVGENYTFTASVTPANASEKTVIWSSSDSKIASVDENGKVTAIAPGSAVITASSADGKYSAICRVTVIMPVLETLEIKTLPDKLSYIAGETLDTTGLTLIATYSNRIVEVDSGYVCSPMQLKAEGTQTITVTYDEKRCFFDVNVKAKTNTVTYYVDGMIYAQYIVKVGYPVPVPAADPVIGDLIFEGWTPTVLSTMPDYSLEYTAVFHSHTFTEKTTVEPTCTKAGVITCTCTCGKTYDKSVEASGHIWGSWITVTEATGTANGSEKKVCDRCKDEEYRVIAKTDANFTVEPVPDRAYTGFPITHSVKVHSLSGERLDEYDHYLVDYENNINVGTAKATVTGIGEYNGTVEVSFNIVKKDVSDLSFSAIPDMTFSGTAITPDPVIYHDDLLLVKGVDYTVEYHSNVNAGTAAIVITGIGNFTGEQTVNFNIKENQTDFVAPIIADQVYTSKEITPEFNLFDKSGKLLEKDVDYSVEYSDNVNVGYGKAVITGMGSYGGSMTVSFRISAVGIDMAAIPELPDAVYSGKEYVPDFAANPIVFNGKKLVEGVDFVAKVNNAGNAGTAEIIVIGIGNFTGSITVYVNINGVDISGKDFKVEKIPDVYYGGKPATPAVNVSYKGKNLVSGTDYTVEYLNNDRKGVATAVIKGIGNFSGEKRVDFVIRSANLVSFDIVTPSDTLGWDKTMQLSLEFNPEYSSVSDVTWSTSDREIATVDENGVVKGQGKGDVTITAVAVDENGNEVTSQITINCTMTFWQRIVRFFRRLFGIGSNATALAVLPKEN